MSMTAANQTLRVFSPQSLNTICLSRPRLLHPFITHSLHHSFTCSLSTAHGQLLTVHCPLLL